MFTRRFSKRTVSVKRMTGITLLCLIAFVFSGIVGSARYKSSQDASPSAVFQNTTPITVSSVGANNAFPYPSAIPVSGLTGTIPATPGSVKVTLHNFSHTFPDDIGMVLVGPTGAALLLQDGAGDAPDISGVTYTLSDDGAAALPNLTAWPNGTYKPTSHYLAGGTSFPAPGPLLAHAHPGPAGGGTATFSSVFGGTNPNGTWNLYVRDFAGGDGGSFAGGWSLEINTGTSGTPQNVVDFDGNGKTDFAVVRNTGGGAGGQITWFVNLNGPGTVFGSAWGISTDFFTPVDFDGDNKTDIAIWRPISMGQPSGNAFFYILQSATNTVRINDFGQSGDDPTVVGDYDGDGKADPAVYRGGTTAGAQSTWYYRGSLTPGNVTGVPWGQNGDFPAPGDYDGDGENDFVVQRNNGGGQARFWMFKTTAGVSTTVFGTPTDVIVPGDYDGDGKTDLAVVRGIAGNIRWFVLPSLGGPYTETTWGISATDFPTQGDYDGDGKTEPAVWRPSVTPGATAFWYLGSTSGPVSAIWGQNGDYPVANYNAH